MMPRRQLVWAVFLLLIGLAVSTPGQQQLASVRVYVPNSSPTLGTPSIYPFSPLDREVSYLWIIRRDRLPRRGGKIQAMYLAVAQTGKIVVDQASILVGHTGNASPDMEFGKNLFDFKEVLNSAISMDESRVIKGRFIRIPFNTHFEYNGRDHLAILVRLRGIKAGVRLMSSSSFLKAVYSRGPGAFRSKRASHGVVPGLTTGLDFLTGSPTITCTSPPLPGSNLNVTFNAAGNIGDAFTAGCSFTSEPGIDIQEYTIPLTADALFYSVWILPRMFMGFGGTVGNAGVSSGAIAIPEEPALIGVSFVMAFVTYKRFTGKITNVSTEQWVTIGLGCGG